MNTIVRAIVVGGVMSMAATHAHALNTRTWVSGTGVDQSGCGPIANPCRSLQYAHNSTSAGGEIDVKDSAGYGSIIITKAITIVGDGSLAGVLAPASGNAITVNAGASDAIILRGLAIEGAGIGINGIVFNSGQSLDIADCVIQNFVGSGPTTGNGVLVQPLSGASSVIISNTTASHNAYVGLYANAPTGSTASVSLVIRNSAAIANKFGIAMNANGVSTTNISGSVTNSVAANNTSGGVFVGIGTGHMSFDLCTSDKNSYGFMFASGTIVIGRSQAMQNATTGIEADPPSVFSFGNNQVAFNGTDIDGTLKAAALH